ncbi:MAG: ribose 5-phosphate isomerase B [Acholeplasmatales bacterium]|nr:ribose 5-phosphate isomerase B [Acholeplasmatales bacterium]
MKIAFACDHGGLELKNHIIEFVKKMGHEVEDFGTYTLDSCDYPVYGKKAAEAVACGKCDRGIVICSTGIGMSIVANKVKGVRCALLTDENSARLTREHNNTNCMAMGQKNVSFDLAERIVTVWLNTEFSNAERHIRRINMIEE